MSAAAAITEAPANARAVAEATDHGFRLANMGWIDIEVRDHPIDHDAVLLTARPPHVLRDRQHPHQTWRYT